jgi:hypothetical protein
MNTNQNAEDFSPDPLALLESNPNLGYSIEEPAADLIDKSITANATIVKELSNSKNTES